MTDISILVEDTKKKGLKIVPNPNKVEGGRDYYLFIEGLANYYGNFIPLNRSNLEVAYLRAMPKILEATGKRYAWYPEKLELLNVIKEDFESGKPIILTAEGTTNEFVVQNRYGRNIKPIKDTRRLLAEETTGSKRFLITCNSLGSE